MDRLITYRPLAVALIAVMLIVGCRGDDSDLIPSTTGQPTTPAPQSALPGLPSLPSLDQSTIITVAGVGPIGDGAPATSARLAFPMGLALDSAGNLFISDSIHQRVRRVDAESGVITTVAGFGEDGFSGDGGPAVDAKLSSPRALAVDRADNVFISDLYNQRVRRIDAATRVITTVAGTGKKGSGGDGGPATEAQLDSPRGLVSMAQAICSSQAATTPVYAE